MRDRKSERVWEERKEKKIQEREGVRENMREREKRKSEACKREKQGRLGLALAALGLVGSQRGHREGHRGPGVVGG